MITKEQATSLSKKFKIDRFTVFREYLQLVALNELYQLTRSTKVYFKGGTAIHFLFGSPRFSEDLDFATKYKTSEIKQIVDELEKKIQLQIPSLAVRLLYKGSKSVRFRLRYKSIDFKYPFAIRLDFFIERKKPSNIKTSPIMTDFPIMFFPVVSHLTSEEILAEKIRAVLIRGKGRDYFDLWFLLEKKVKIEEALVEKKMNQVGKKFSRQDLIEKVRKISTKEIKKDLSQFLPPMQGKAIPQLKERLLIVFSQTSI